MSKTAEIDPMATSTVLPNGDIVPVFAGSDGRCVIGVGELETKTFIRHATDLLEAYGQSARVAGEDCIIRRHALVVLDETGQVTVQWNVDGTWERVSETTPGAVSITMTEF